MSKFLSRFGTFSVIISLNKPSASFSFFSLLGPMINALFYPMINTLFLLIVSYKSYMLSLFLFIHFSFAPQVRYLNWSSPAHCFFLAKSAIEILYWILQFHHCILQYENWFGSFLWFLVSLLNFSFCSCIVFPDIVKLFFCVLL